MRGLGCLLAFEQLLLLLLFWGACVVAILKAQM
jgi:hypothetical protein